jgi:RNA polymerase sigma factor (sigma-70 family)
MVTPGERPEWFWSLWRKHAIRLFAICLREMDRNRADAEDAVAEAMLRAYSKIPASLDNAEAWLTRVTINVCRDLHRRRVRSETLKNQYARFQLSRPPDEENPRDEEYDLIGLLDRLPAPLREPLLLRAVHGKPYDAIAAHLGIAPANVRKRVQLARAALRALRDAARN